MIRFSREKVLLLHQLVTEETGGAADVRDLDLLDSALASAFQTFDGKELYPTVQMKAATLLYLLVKNHSFVDGNKRIAAFIFLWYMSRNDILYRVDGSKIVSDGALVALTLLIAESKPEERETMTKLIVNLIM